jgi:pimeloyl-ACP methyl ester carboxylesterase
MTRLTTFLLMGLVVSGPAARAQDRPVVFVHGFGSSGDTWRGAASRLQSRLAIHTETPSLGSNALYETQAHELQQRLGGTGADVIAIGHSNGGVVARQWSRQHPVSGILTVNSPHGGAPIVSNIYNYAGFNAGLVGSINDVFRVFGQGCCSWQWIVSAYAGVWDFAANAAAVSIAHLSGAIALNAALPVSPSMAPGSGYLSSLNSGGNLAREAADVPVRAGIASTARNFYWGGAFRAIYPDKGDEMAYWRDAARFGMQTYAAYIYANAPYEDWWAFEIASSMLTAAHYLSIMDEWWCQSVSVVGLGACWVNDTMLPQWTQVYPGGLFVDTGWSGPAHTQATRMSDALIDQVLTHHMAVPLRGGGPPPPPGAEQARFYEHVEFDGESFAAASNAAFVGWEWNDRLSSVHVPAGQTVVLYEHAEFGGESLTLTADEPDLRRHPGPGADGTWNDVVSAVQVY